MSPVAARLASKSAAAMRLEGRVPFDRASFGTAMRNFVGKPAYFPAEFMKSGRQRETANENGV
jgi:hypothetical protein